MVIEFKTNTAPVIWAKYFVFQIMEKGFNKTIQDKST